MKVNIDTKEKFTVITPTEPEFCANLAESFGSLCQEIANGSPKNMVLNLQQVNQIDETMANLVMDTQQSFYEKSNSFVICNIQPSVAAVLEELEIAEILNITPTESEAWDIVQMEEIERELMDSDDITFENIE